MCQRMIIYILLLAAPPWRCRKYHIMLDWQRLHCLTGTLRFRLQYLQSSWWHLPTSCLNPSSSTTLSPLPCQKLRYCTSAMYKTVACLCWWWLSLHPSGQIAHHWASCRMLWWVIPGPTSRSKHFSYSSWCWWLFFTTFYRDDWGTWIYWPSFTPLSLPLSDCSKAGIVHHICFC